MSSKFTCRFCKDQFDAPKGLYQHLQSVHSAGTSRDNRTCPICGVLCLKYEGYRDHLLYIHGQTDEGLKLTFKTLNEFLVWKAELELKHNCKYVLQSSPKVLPSKEKKYFYQCDRSDPKDKKDKKSVSVVMKTCTSVISVVEGINVFKVEYWDTHSGHSETPSAQSLQNELEAAISSVEMVNAIADSDDSYDRSEEASMIQKSNSSVSNAEKKSNLLNTKSSPKVNNFLSNLSTLKKTNIAKPSNKIDSSTKKNSNTVLFSLASVACGKGIAKKRSAKADGNKDNTKASPENSKNTDEDSVKIPEVKKSDSAPPVTIAPQKNSPVVSSKNSSEASTVTTTVSTSLSKSTKTISSGLPAIAPKITSALTALSSTSFATINSLINSNSAFPNQLVIVNPAGVDQNSLNSKQNILTAGQNIILSLGSPGQNIAPTVTQPINVVSGGDKKGSVAINKKETKRDSSKTTSSSSLLKSSVSSVTSIASNTASVTIKSGLINNAPVTLKSGLINNVPVTMKSGLNNAPVILSSLPIGSTFMSVNNNLIPIATPSGTFLPTSLPPNIVLTPVGTTTSLPSTNSTQKNTLSSITNVVNSPMSNIQSQMRFTPSSTVAITVSSIVKEPVYSSSAVKQVSQIVASSTIPISSTSSHKTYSKSQNKSIPTTISGNISPLKNVTKYMSSTPLKSNLKSLKANGLEITSAVNKTVSSFTSKLNDDVPSRIGISAISSSSVLPSVTVSSISSPKSRTSARKRISTAKSKLDKSSLSNLSSTSILSPPGNTKVVNSQLNLAPISSATITSQPMNIQNSGTLLIESAGDVYMLEPMETDAVSIKPMTDLAASKIKIDRAMQTSEEFSVQKPKISRKRSAAFNEDSAVMLKVKCYQLEMNYLSILTECKRLKVELTKERLKNAELAGEKVPDITEGDIPPDTSRSKASEIMKEIEENLMEKSDVNIYTMTKTSVLRSLYEDLEDLCVENTELNKELENYRAHDKFYKSLKKKLYEEEF